MFVNVPISKHVASDSGVSGVKVIVANCSPDAANFDLQTTFMRQTTSNKSDVCITKYIHS